MNQNESQGARRRVHFSTLDQVVDDAQRMHQSGYDRCGNWSLGQMCNHIAASIDMTLGLRLPGWLQKSFIFTFLNLTFVGKIGNVLGLRLPTSLPQNEPVDDQVGLERLQTAIGKLIDSGIVPQQKFHLWHCEHHLSFLIPREPS